MRSIGRLEYQPQLDGFRALAVLAVIASHTGSSITGGGSLGVDLFFVLSGYLITTLALREKTGTGRVDLRAFYIRRARRLAPALVLVVAATATIYGAFDVGGAYATATVKEVPSSLLYVISWLRAFRVGDAGALTHTWSLSVEEHFYLVWPVVLIMLSSRGPTFLRRGVLAVWLGSVAYALAWAYAGASQQRMYFAPDTRIYSILSGCALAVLLAQMARPRRRRVADVALAGALVFIGLMMLKGHFAWRPYYLGLGACLSVAAAVVVGHLALWPASPLGRLLASRPLVWTGRRSYGLYLWQVPVLAFFDLEASSMHALRVVIGIGVTFALAAASYRYVERPLLAARTSMERGEVAVSTGSRSPGRSPSQEPTH